MIVGLGSGLLPLCVCVCVCVRLELFSHEEILFVINSGYGPGITFYPPLPTTSGTCSESCHFPYFSLRRSCLSYCFRRVARRSIPGGGFICASSAHWTVWYIQPPIQRVGGAVYPKERTGWSAQSAELITYLTLRSELGIRGTLPPFLSYAFLYSVLCKRGAFWFTAVARSWAFKSIVH